MDDYQKEDYFRKDFQKQNNVHSVIGPSAYFFIHHF